MHHPIVRAEQGGNPVASDSAAATLENTATPTAARTLRLAQFNIRELTKEKLATVDADGVGSDAQVRAAATIVQRVRPDVLVINEIDHDYSEPGTPLDSTARLFEQNYLATGDAAIRERPGSPECRRSAGG